MIDLLSAAVSTLRDGAAAMKAENAELRAAYERVRGHGGANGDADATSAPVLTVPATTDQVGRLGDAARAFGQQHGVTRPDVPSSAEGRW